MNILVVGGSGFIGTRLVDELVEAQHNVRIFDLRISEKHPQITTVGDVRSKDSLITATKGIDAIFNLAAEHRDDVTPLSLYHDVNVKGAENIIAAAEENGVNRIIFTSSVAIYGLDKDCPDENFPAEPFNEYGRSKFEAEKIFLSWQGKNSNRNLVIFRPAVIFGENNRGNVYNLIKQIQSKRFFMIGSGTNKKSMGYVGNIAYILSQQLSGQGVKIYNYCDKPDLTSRQIAHTISEQIGRPLPRLSLPTFIGDMAGLTFDLAAKITGKKFPISRIRIRKFSAETTISTDKLISDGFKGKYTLQEGLHRMINADFNHPKS